MAAIVRNGMFASSGRTLAVQHPGVDVALAELAEPVESVEPLAVRTEVPEPRDSVVLAGWGQRR